MIDHAGQAAVIVAGSINVDLIVGVSRLPTPGETVLGERFTQQNGGKSANQAVAAARVGARVTMLDRKTRPQALPEDDQRFFYACGDITDDAFVAATLDDATARFGGVDHLVNAAGSFAPQVADRRRRLALAIEVSRLGIEPGALQVRRVHSLSLPEPQLLATAAAALRERFQHAAVRTDVQVDRSCFCRVGEVVAQ